ncbi:MAG TPA: hypothetical protein VNG33_12130 [Polyangiaceae bacterium]|nr:hypothetical protein [Polyangiaceae bacterium]
MLGIVGVTHPALGGQEAAGQPAASAAEVAGSTVNQRNTVGAQRHFDDRRLRLGIETNFIMLGLAASYTPLEVLSVGVSGGFTLQGPAFGAQARLRPVVWGGHTSPGRTSGLLSAFFIQAGYNYMRYALDPSTCFDPFSGPEDAPCHTTHYLPLSAQFASAALGTEHEWASGFGVYWSLGLARALVPLVWHCEQDGQSVPCTHQQTTLVGRFSLGLSYAF